jgi:hypothetical protein
MAASQIRAVPSPLAVACQVPSGATATAYTGPLAAARMAMSIVASSPRPRFRRLPDRYPLTASALAAWQSGLAFLTVSVHASATISGCVTLD